MTSFRQDNNLRATISVDDDILITKLLLSHDPDGRSLDSEQLIYAVENIMFYATTTASEYQVFEEQKDRVSAIELVGSEDSLGNTIYKVSQEMLLKIFGDGNLHVKTMMMFDLLGNYKWDAKVGLILAAFALYYGEFCLIMQFPGQIPLAKLIAFLKQVPDNTNKLWPQLKALRLLVKTMVDVTKCIIKFEALPIGDVMMDTETIAVTKNQIYIAAYWIIRSAMACSSQVMNLKAIKAEQVDTKTTTAAWELSSLMYRLSNILSQLKQNVDSCHEEIEAKLHQKLLNIFKESHEDNQEMLRSLFALKDDFPLKECSAQVKLGVSELKNKVVILLISKPELLPFEEFIFLVQQTYDHPHRKMLQESYEIVWCPITFSSSWTSSEEESFNFFSNALPWSAVRKPWSINPAITNFIKKEWNFEEKSTMVVVLGSQGKITNFNAMDMISIWGPKACPFSLSRQKELWEEEKWTMQLLIDEIDPLLAHWVEEGRILCVYGSNNIDWIAEFSTKLKQIKKSGIQLEMVYVGVNKPDRNVETILAKINEEIHRNSLSFTKMKFFWLRLESIRRSKVGLGTGDTSTDYVLQEVSALLDTDENEKGWAVFGAGQAEVMVRTQGSEIIDCLNLFREWGGNVGKMGFLGALKNALKPPEPRLPVEGCGHSDLVAYNKETIEENMVCGKCNHLMKKKFIIYE